VPPPTATPPAVITPPPPAPAEPDEAVDLVVPPVEDAPTDTPVASPAPAAADLAVGPADDRAVAVPLGPVVDSADAGEPVDRASLEHGDGEPDPQEVRRRIATASRSFDPDDQVRRAMDAFFSPSVPPRQDQTTPEH
jgi:hypothetical protein